MTSRKFQGPLIPLAIVAFSFLFPAHGWAQDKTAHARTTFDLQTATVADINAAMDAGALSSEKLVRLYLNRIDAYDKKGPKINSVITLNPKALEEARALDAERKTKGRRSPLHGIPIVVKDLIDVAGLPTTAAFKPFGAPIPGTGRGDCHATGCSRCNHPGESFRRKLVRLGWFRCNAPDRCDAQSL